MNNELYLGPSVDVTHSNQLGAAALNMLTGAAELGHEKKVNVEDYSALRVAYILFNDEPVGLFIYDEDDGTYVHHQFMSSRVERCLLAHAVEISAPFRSAEILDRVFAPVRVPPEMLLQSALTHLTASQRLHRKIRAVRQSPTPVYAVRSPVSESVVMTRLQHEQCTEHDKGRIEDSPHFVAWLSDKSDEQLAHLLEGCRLSDRPAPFKVLFETPERITLQGLRILDTFDACSSEIACTYADDYELTRAEAKTQTSDPLVRHLIDHALIHGTRTPELVHNIRAYWCAD